MVPEVLSQVLDIGSLLLSATYTLTSLDSQRFSSFTVSAWYPVNYNIL